MADFEFPQPVLTGTVSNGLDAISCSLERARSLLDGNNTDLHEAIDAGTRERPSAAYRCWLTYILLAEELARIDQMISITLDKSQHGE